ncbi:MAG TPA: hypothetical protein VMB51_08160 [Solirubrobacteraceae bacterium]|nr:hypothetical protein [Solirubrobacteraceae bacterium]
MLGLCLMALLAMAATTAVVASPALASCNEECKAQKEKEKQERKEQKEKEKEEAKKQKEKEKAEKEVAEGKYSIYTWGQYKHCPFGNEEFADAVPLKSRAFCFVGRTKGGSEGGFFILGGVTVKLSKPITLQGGYLTHTSAEKTAIKTEQKECEANPEYSPVCKEAEESPEGFEKYWKYKVNNLKVVAAEGAETLEAPELKVNKGLKLITQTIQEDQEWPAELSAALKEAERNGEGNVYAKIEVAGSGLYETYGGLNTTNLLDETGPAFILPLKVRLINPFLEKLGGGPCTIGNDGSPITQRLTSEPPGRFAEPGAFKHNEAFTQLEIGGSRLVDLSWPVPEEAKASGCGGSYESYVNAALDEVLELSPAARGTTFLQGTLWTGNAYATKKAFEEGLP